MLLLSRKKGEKVRIGLDIEVTVLDVQGDKVRLGFSAPRDVSINREEVFNRIHGENLGHVPPHRRLVANPR